jgi:hypothetical protein
MTKMDDLGSLALHYASHDIDGSIMSVEEGGSSNNTDLIDWGIWH